MSEQRYNGTIVSGRKDGKLANSDNIFDKDRRKMQSDINKEMKTRTDNSFDSLKQTKQSAEDGGENVITLTRHDGTSEQVKFYNGSKGSKGDKGDKGDKGEVGMQGNSGVADASNKTLVNDAITGGETDFLSAEVGKLGILTYDCSKGGTVTHTTLQDAINSVPTTFQKVGLTITYKSGNTIYRYTLKANAWSADPANWFSVEDKLSDLANKSKELEDNIGKKADAEQVNNSLYDLEKKIGDRFVVEGDVTNLPDEEDLTSVKESERNVLKLADRSYAPEKFSGKGYKILRRNIKPVSIAVTKIRVESVPSSDGKLSFSINGRETQVTVSVSTDNTTALVVQKVASSLQESLTEYEVSADTSLITLTRMSGGSVTPSAFSASTTGVVCTITDSTKKEFRNILTPSMINQPNTIYEIRYDFDLNQNIINMPSNSVLCFKGGSFVNGSLYGTDTELINFHNVLNVELLGSFTNNGFHVSNYFKLVEKYNCILSASLLYISKYDSFLDDCMKFQNMLGIDYYHICLNIDVDSSSNPTKIIYATKCEYDKVTTLEEIINILNVSIPLCKHGIFEGIKIHTENSCIDKLLTNVTNGKSQILKFFDLYLNDLEKFRNLNCCNEVTFFAFMNEENQLFNIEDKDIIDKLKQVIQKIKSIFPKAKITYSASHYIEYSSIIQYMNYPSLNLYLHDLSYKGIDTKVTDVINNYSTIKRQIEHTLSNLVNFRLTEFGALNNEHGLIDGASYENRGKELEPFYAPYLHCLALFVNIDISRFIGFSIWYFDSYYIKNDTLYTYWGDKTVSNGYLTDIISIFKFTFYENI